MFSFTLVVSNSGHISITVTIKWTILLYFPNQISSWTPQSDVKSLWNQACVCRSWTWACFLQHTAFLFSGIVFCTKHYASCIISPWILRKLIIFMFVNQCDANVSKHKSHPCGQLNDMKMRTFPGFKEKGHSVKIYIYIYFNLNWPFLKREQIYVCFDRSYQA